LRVLLLLAAALPVFAAEPRITFEKSFPGSVPAYVQVVVDKSGAAEYREDPKDDNPLKFQLKAGDTDTIFALAEKLGYFNHPLEASVKVAFMGAKTFRYSDGTNPGREVKFNYSEDVDAKTLLDWFERISESERNYIELERSVRFDKLGVQDAILRIEVLRNQQRLVAEQQFLPMLDRVQKNESFLHMARDRAAGLAESIRASQ